MKNTEQYIQSFDVKTQQKLHAIQNAVLELDNRARQRMYMGIPAFELNGKILVSYAGYKKHIGFYPEPETIEAFKDSLQAYKTSKGSVQFPLDQPLPMDLIRSMIQYRIQLLEKNG